MPLPRETPEEELRQTVARLQTENTALRTQCTPSTSRDDNSGDNNLPQNVQRIESFYRVPKIPPFFRADPSLWFLQVEASLRNAGISNQVTIADTVISHLDVEDVLIVSDLITSRDPNIQYTCIKEIIISSFATSSETPYQAFASTPNVASSSPNSALERKVEEMQKSFDRQINKILALVRPRSRSRGRHNPFTRKRSRSRSADGICRIHRKYGDKSRYLL